VRGRSRLSKCRAVGEAGSHDWDADGVRRERPDDEALPGRVVSLVEDDHGLRTGGHRVQRLDRERAGPALNERDVAGPGEVKTGEVGGLATARARPRRLEVDVDGDDRPAELARPAVRERAGIVRSVDRSQLVELNGEVEFEVERVEGDVVPRRFQPPRDIGDAVRVTLGASSTRAGVERIVIRIRDPLQRCLMRPDSLHCHAREQLCVRVVVLVVA
jgi:hypothetical protein